MYKYCFLTFLVASFLISCSIANKPFKAKDNVAEYAESLFMQQNALTQQVIMLFSEDIALADEDKVSQAELQMHDACYLLIEFANREMEGKKMSVFFKRRVKNSFKACDESIKN